MIARCTADHYKHPVYTLAPCAGRVPRATNEYSLLWPAQVRCDHPTNPRPTHVRTACRPRCTYSCYSLKERLKSCCPGVILFTGGFTPPMNCAT